MVRLLKLLDFQPRLGVVTRSLWWVPAAGSWL